MKRRNRGRLLKEFADFLVLFRVELLAKPHQMGELIAMSVDMKMCARVLTAPITIVFNPEKWRPLRVCVRIDRKT